MANPFLHHTPKKTEVVTMGNPTAIVTLKSLLATTEFESGVSRVWLQNLDTSNNIYWAYGSSAPGAVTSMMVITPLDVWPLDYRRKHLEMIYVGSDVASQKIGVQQDGVDSPTS